MGNHETDWEWGYWVLNMVTAKSLNLGLRGGEIVIMDSGISCGNAVFHCGTGDTFTFSRRCFSGQLRGTSCSNRAETQPLGGTVGQR